MDNTFLLDVDLLFRRVPLDDEDLVDIEFADMEPVDADDLVGVLPHECRASVPVEPYDMVGVAGHAAVATTFLHARRRLDGRTPPWLQDPSEAHPFGAEELETEEFVPGP